MSITYYGCVFVILLIQHAKRMQRIILSFASCPVIPYFSTLSRKRHDFRKSVLNIKCVLRFALRLMFEEFLTIRIIRRDTIINVP
jgi:hypothetical protein